MKTTKRGNCSIVNIAQIERYIKLNAAGLK